MCCKRYHINFSTFSLNFKCKISVQEEVIYNFFFFKKIGHVTSYELTHFKKTVRVWRTKSLLFCVRYDPLIVFRRQNHVTFIFIKKKCHIESANGLLRKFWWNGCQIQFTTLAPKSCHKGKERQLYSISLEPELLGNR